MQKTALAVSSSAGRLRVAEGSVGLPYPHGLAFSPDSASVADRELSHRVPRASDGARPRYGRAHYPQPARLSRAALVEPSAAASGCQFSHCARTSSNSYCARTISADEMMRTIAPNTGSRRRSRQAAMRLSRCKVARSRRSASKNPGHPRAPTASSRGSTRMVTSSRACIAASAAAAMASPRLAKQRKVSSSSPKGTDGRY